MTAKRDRWMPLYIADYLADTTHLSVAQHGAYLLLIFAYWKSGPLPDDDKTLSRMARCDLRQWRQAVGATVREFFQTRDGKLHHKRIDQERAKTAAISEARRGAALTGRQNGTDFEPNGEPSEAPTGGDSKARSRGKSYAAGSQICDLAGSQNRDIDAQHSDGVNGLNSFETTEAIAPAIAEQLQTHARDAHARGLQSPLTKKEYSVLRTDAGASPGGSGPKADLFRFGTPTVARLAGLDTKRARAVVGKLMQALGDDGGAVMAVLREAESLQPIDPVAWMIAAAQARAGVRLTPARARKAESDRKLRQWLEDTAEVDHPDEIATAGERTLLP
jgi:uncharacterized protein YdaU (DUF1376 family)